MYVYELQRKPCLKKGNLGKVNPTNKRWDVKVLEEEKIFLDPKEFETRIDILGKILYDFFIQQFSKCEGVTTYQRIANE